MLSQGDRVVVAVSGGPDSVCLLHLLMKIAPEYQLQIFVAHLNHMLREEAVNEEKFVRQMTKRMSLPFHSEKMDVRAQLKKGESLEEGARRIRYEFLKRACRRFSASKVAMGHNADDLVETLLFNLIRGTGLGGIRGIPPIRYENSIAFIRPLINIWREEIEKYLQENQIPYMIDRSNLSLQFTRNKIRHQILPLLREINPRAKEAIHRFATIAEEAHSFIREEAMKTKEALCKRKTKNSLQLNFPLLVSLPPILQKETLKIILSEFIGNMREIGSEELERIVRIREGEIITMPGTLRVERKGEDLIFLKRRRRAFPYEVPLQIPGSTFIPEAGVEIEGRVVEGNFVVKDPACLEVTLDMGKIKGKLVARNWRKGDRMVPLGMREPKKLQDVFVDCKVPREERHIVPLICDEEGIIWIVGLRISERVKVGYETNRILHLKTVYHREVQEE